MNVRRRLGFHQTSDTRCSLVFATVSSLTVETVIIHIFGLREYDWSYFHNHVAIRSSRQTKLTELVEPNNLQLLADFGRILAFGLSDMYRIVLLLHGRSFVRGHYDRASLMGKLQGVEHVASIANESAFSALETRNSCSLRFFKKPFAL